ncbi:hypothetical protein ACI65C_000008 [Semiaphis heraclei]
MVHTARDYGADVVLVSEQYRNSGEDIAIKGERIYSVYCSPNVSVDEYNEFLNRLEDSMQGANGPVFVGGDFNAKRPEWGLQISDIRKDSLAELLCSLDLHAYNVIVHGLFPTKRIVEWQLPPETVTFEPITAGTNALSGSRALFNARIQHPNGTQKALRTTVALFRLMPDVRGPRPLVRKLLNSVVRSQLLYAAPVWNSSLLFHNHSQLLLGPQRAIALRVTSAYRTVSMMEIMVVTSIVLVHLMVRGKTDLRRMLQNITEEARQIIDENIGS